MKLTILAWRQRHPASRFSAANGGSSCCVDDTSLRSNKRKDGEHLWEFQLVSDMEQYDSIPVLFLMFILSEEWGLVMGVDKPAEQEHCACATCALCYCKQRYRWFKFSLQIISFFKSWFVSTDLKRDPVAPRHVRCWRIDGLTLVTSSFQ